MTLFAVLFYCLPEWRDLCRNARYKVEQTRQSEGGEHMGKLLKWLFDHYERLTLAVLTGFIIGSLNKIWPWKEVLQYRLNSHGEQVPFFTEETE